MHLEVRVPQAGRVEVMEAERPEPQPGQVRVAVRRCGICGSDLHFFSGRQPPPPVCPGHEISGIVEAAPGQPQDLREGDRVTIEPLTRCGQCRYCRAGDYHLCPALQIHGIMLPGGMASSIVVPAYTVHRLPAAVDFDVGAMTEPLAVAVHALRLGGIGRDTPVLVLGAGTVGLLTVAAARHLGAPFVAITGRHEHQRRAAAALGADQVLEPQEVSAVGETPRIVVETVGGEADTVDQAITAVDRGGTVVIVGMFDRAPAFSPLLHLIKEARIVGSMIYNASRGRSDFEVALDIASAEHERLARLVTHRFALAAAQEAFETAADKQTGAIKVLVGEDT
ncbi:MAG: hypothetical protein D6815_06970 [Candidatus Dadabacteria bacterium]|nr:MAG: hypothetical protein D6815_06970 [Candidatus Dadabacteria bacterium]